MLCDECNGSGGIVSDDGGDAETCWWCKGTGRVPWYDYFCVWAGVKWSRLRDQIRFTRIENRYWRRWGRERNARKLARAHTRFALVVLHGRRLERLRIFADAVEGGTEMGYVYRVESRLVAEAARAIEIVDGVNP